MTGTLPGIQRVSYQAALLGAHTAGVGVYHVRQKDKSDGGHAAPQAAGAVPRGQTGTARHRRCASDGTGMPCPERGKSVRGTGRQVFHPAGERRTGSVHVHSLSRHGAYQQRIRTHAAQGGDTPKDTPEACDRRRKDHVQHHNDVSAHVGQDGAELVRKTVRSLLGDLT